MDGVEVETTGGEGDGDGDGEVEGEGSADPLVLSCLEGERHDVSRGDIIEFQWTRGGGGGGGMGGRRSEEEDVPFTNSNLDNIFDLRRRSRIMG